MPEDNHVCHQQDLLREMHSDIRGLLTEFKNMNGSLRNTIKQVGDHCNESMPYRRKIDQVWTVMHFLKWFVGFVVGGGLIWNAIQYLG